MRPVSMPAAVMLTLTGTILLAPLAGGCKSTPASESAAASRTSGDFQYGPYGAHRTMEDAREQRRAQKEAEQEAERPPDAEATPTQAASPSP